MFKLGAGKSHEAVAQATRNYIITPSDEADLAHKCTIYLPVAGAVAYTLVDMPDTESAPDPITLTAGYHPKLFKKIWATGTTGSLVIEGLY